MTNTTRHISDKTQLIVDMIGPLVNIGNIPAFRNVDARYKTEDEIVEDPNLPPRSDGQTWTKEQIRELCTKYLGDPRTALQVIDDDMLAAIHEARQEGVEVRIVSSVDDSKLFQAASAVLKRRYEQLFPDGPTLGRDPFEHVPREESQLSSTALYLKARPEDAKKIYTIVVDDTPPFSLAPPETIITDKWLSGHDNQSMAARLSRILSERSRLKDAHAFVKRFDTSIKLEDYKAFQNFLVADAKMNATIALQVSMIHKLHETMRKPVCVFLGGPPGSGKSYFVEQFSLDLQNSSTSFPHTSLSGVARRKFASAVEHHIDMVYDQLSDAPAVAFLDEVDTEIPGNDLAFRLLMDAMTGTRTDDLGLAMKGQKSGRTKDLIWFFAGSRAEEAGGFVEALRSHDPKVVDFFDRIHLFVRLPGAQSAREAIILMASNFSNLYADELKSGLKVERNVAFAFGATRWNSVRQLSTVCQLIRTGIRDLASRPNSRCVITMEDCLRIGEVPSFTPLLREINASPEAAFGDEVLTIIPLT